jgi:hypothetical protein
MTPIERGLAITLLIVALCAGVWAFWRHYEGLVADKATAEIALVEANGALDQEKAEHEAAKAENARLDALQANRGRVANQLKKERDYYADKLAKAMLDPEARKWLDADVPRAVWCGMRQRPEGVVCDEDGKGLPANQLDGRDTHPNSARQDRLRLEYVLAGPGGRAAELQRRQGQLAGLGAAGGAR